LLRGGFLTLGIKVQAQELERLSPDEATKLRITKAFS
jgi:hypothetical protein